MRTLDARLLADARELEALAVSEARGRVALTNLRVSRRHRRGARRFFVTASCGRDDAPFDVTLACVARRADEDAPSADAPPRMDPEAHAAAYDRAHLGAVVARAWGVLDPRAAGRVVVASSRDEDATARGRARRCRACGGAACAGAAGDAPCPNAAPLLRCEGIAFRDEPRSPVPRAAAEEDADAPPPPPPWLVFDMAYDTRMTAAEHGALSRQVSMCVAANRRAMRPFQLAVVTSDPRDDVVGGVDGDDPKEKNPNPLRLWPDLPPPARGRNAWRFLPWREWGVSVRGGPGAFARLLDSPSVKRAMYLTADASECLEDVRAGDALVVGGVVDHAEKPEEALRRFDALVAFDAREEEEGSYSPRVGIAPGEEGGTTTIITGTTTSAEAHRAVAGSNPRGGGGGGAAGDASAFARLRAARLPLGGHVRLAKNAHLTCLAVAQLLAVFAEVKEERARRGADERGDGGGGDGGGTRGSGGGSSGARDGDDDDDDDDDGGRKEGGEYAAAWGEAIARCPAFRCAPLAKYVTFLPPHDHLNRKLEKGGGARDRPQGVTDTRALASA